MIRPVSPRLSNDLTRAFVAIELPGSLRQALARQVTDLRAALGEAELRWVRPESIHLTLRFLGETSQANLEAVQAAMREVGTRHRALPSQVAGLGRFPGGARPRVVWIGVDEPTGELVAMQAELELRIAGVGFRREERPFHPHLTLARVRREASAAGLRRLSEQLDRQRVGELGALPIDHLSLMRSQLGGGGATYSCLARVALAGTG
jgi:2'-5' RNA ligase